MSTTVGMLELRKAKTARGRRALKARQPQLIERVKRCMLVKGPRSSETLNQFMLDMKLLRAPDVVYMTRKNQVRPFEDQTGLEFLAKKNDSGLFVYVSHSKKRPDNVVFGRFFNYQTLDMMEFGLKDFASLTELKTKKCQTGSKPCLLFVGDEFESNADLGVFKNLMVDLFRGRVVEAVDLVGLDHVFVFTAHEGKVHVRTYTVTFKKSGSRVPNVALEVMGPCFDLEPRRVFRAAEAVQKEARRVPKQLRAKKRKNISTNVFGEEIGRIHVQQQDLKTLQLKKMKAYNPKRDTVADEGEDGDDAKVEGGGKRQRTSK